MSTVPSCARSRSSHLAHRRVVENRLKVGAFSGTIRQVAWIVKLLVARALPCGGCGPPWYNGRAHARLQEVGPIDEVGAEPLRRQGQEVRSADPLVSRRGRKQAGVRSDTVGGGGLRAEPLCKGEGGRHGRGLPRVGRGSDGELGVFRWAVTSGILTAYLSLASILLMGERPAHHAQLRRLALQQTHTQQRHARRRRRSGSWSGRRKSIKGREPWAGAKSTGWSIWRTDAGTPSIKARPPLEGGVTDEERGRAVGGPGGVGVGKGAGKGAGAGAGKGAAAGAGTSLVGAGGGGPGITLGGGGRGEVNTGKAGGGGRRHFLWISKGVVRPSGGSGGGFKSSSRGGGECGGGEGCSYTEGGPGAVYGSGGDGSGSNAGGGTEGG
jgi:hypothetical protein